ncbi:MAG: hypothetical protein HZB13_07995 [Acidobacteria bacterium]|nr:hypothetical protein [Acidobacteriota bacterium]
MHPESTALLGQFNRLIEELLTGRLHRTRFEAWEMEILLDIEGASLTGAARKKHLQGYQRAVQQQLQRGAARPRSFSEYLSAVQTRGRQRKPPAAEAPGPPETKTGTE